MFDKELYREHVFWCFLESKWLDYTDSDYKLWTSVKKFKRKKLKKKLWKIWNMEKRIWNMENILEKIMKKLN